MYEDYDETIKERYQLAMERIASIPSEENVPAPFDDYFHRVAEFLLLTDHVGAALRSGQASDWDLKKWQEINGSLYADIMPGRYEKGYADPAYAVRVLGDSYGKMLSFLYAQMRGLIVYQYEGLVEESVIHLELFIQIYNLFEQEAPSDRQDEGGAPACIQQLPPEKELEQVLYWFAYDDCDILCQERIRQSVDPERDFALHLVMDSDLSDPVFLYRYGEYITQDELETWKYLSGLPQKEIDQIAQVFVDGYRTGFEKAGKDLSRKGTVNIRYHIGFERVVRRAIENFTQLGLRPVIYRCAVSALNRRGRGRIGYTGANPNPQYDFDHSQDCALYLDRRYVSRWLDVSRAAYEQFKTQARQMAGPAVIETFGEEPFAPRQKKETISLTDRQQKLQTSAFNRLGQISDEFIPGDERSFTIIAFPLPSIGKDYEEIFARTLEVNTLDQKLFERIQQTLIGALDRGERVHIKGMNGNRTDLTVALMEKKNPEKETVFENCLADVNIPVGEVFTSPRLEGTQGVLHVKQVYLNGLDFHNLELDFQDGLITDYGCTNFDREEEGRSYIRSSILYHHDTLPMGEFAIGTNTYAYVMARKYHIEEKLPILIAEKTGPHFAVGDTCYCHQEDVPTYNPDGKECIARENSISALRKTDPEKAYFDCHTDITIPYDQLGLIEVICPDGTAIELIRNGRFVLPGTQQLNEPLDSL